MFSKLAYNSRVTPPLGKGRVGGSVGEVVLFKRLLKEPTVRM